MLPNKHSSCRVLAQPFRSFRPGTAIAMTAAIANIIHTSVDSISSGWSNDCYDSEQQHQPKEPYVATTCICSYLIITLIILSKFYTPKFHPLHRYISLSILGPMAGLTTGTSVLSNRHTMPQLSARWTSDDSGRSVASLDRSRSAGWYMTC